MGILEHCLLYVTWGILDIAGLIMLGENILVWNTRKKKIGLIISIIYNLIVSILFAISISKDMDMWSGVLFLFYFLKAVPVLRSYFFHVKFEMTIIIVLLYQEVISLVGQTIMHMFGRQEYISKYIGWSDNFAELITATILVLFLTILLRLKKESSLMTYFKEVPFKIYVILSIVLLGMGIVENSLFGVDSISGADLTYIRIFAVVLISSLTWLIVELIRLNQKKVTASRSAEFATRQIKSMTEYYNELSIKETELKRFRHDVKNMFIVLHSMLEDKEYKKAVDYIGEMESIYKGTLKGYDTGNIIADAILNAKMHRAQKYDIKIEVEGYVPTQNIEDMDLSILLSNALDNAIEACKKIDGEKIIKVDSALAKRMWVLSIRNPVKTEIVIKDNKIKTSKKNKEMHGYGILNMERVAKNYNGTFEINCADGEFITQATLCLGKKN